MSQDLHTSTDAGEFQLGPYRLHETLGSGCVATVYRAHHTGLARDVALKVFNRTHESNEQTLERFQREAKILAQLEHPGIVRVLDVGQDQGMHYIAMDLVKGNDLVVAMAAGKAGMASAPPFPLDRSLRLMRDIARGVAHIHHQGFIHRDIKPANILIAADGNPLVTDFGLGRELGSALCLAKMNRPKLAFKAFKRSFQRGFKQWAWISREPAFK